MRSDRERFEDILDAISKVEKYSARGRDAFESDELIQTWIVHQLQIRCRVKSIYANRC